MAARVNGKVALQLMEEHLEVVQAARLLAQEIEAAAQRIAQALAEGSKVLLCGNGGSAADAQHIAAELVGRFLKERRALPALALNTNTSIVSAIGNDYGFAEVFARQVAALGQAGDVLVAISTSGNSPNVLRAAETAQEKGLVVIGLTGASGGRLAALCDLCLRVPSASTPRIQEVHILIGHIISQLIEEHAC